MLGDVETLALLFLADPQADDHIGDLQQDEGADRVVGEIAAIPSTWIMTWPGLPSIRPPRRRRPTPEANTPVSSAPTMPPTPCTPKTSRLSS